MAGSGVHAVMGTGGAPEGVLTAAAMRCLNGEIFARLVVSKPEHEERCRAMGITDFKKVYRSKDLAPGKSIIFAATGVTDGTLMKGVRFFGDGNRTSSVIMQNEPHQIRFIDSIHVATSKARPDSFLEGCAACSSIPTRHSGTRFRKRRSGFGTAASSRCRPTRSTASRPTLSAPTPSRACSPSRDAHVDQALPLIAADADQIADAARPAAAARRHGWPSSSGRDR